ncbi:GMP synthase domain protein [Trichuris suis]|nr:GMP synthase domain protein [Trichuris suis]
MGAWCFTFLCICAVTLVIPADSLRISVAMIPFVGSPTEASVIIVCHRIHGWDSRWRSFQNSVGNFCQRCRMVEWQEAQGSSHVLLQRTPMTIVKEVMTELNLSFGQVYLAQGTLRPDLIESASSIASMHANVIKTHHNDTRMVRQLRQRGYIIEPLKDFHKDEVRCLGRDLGLPETILERHPFPGPGLAVRIICRIEPFIPIQFQDTQNILRRILSLNENMTEAHVDLLLLFVYNDLETLFKIPDEIFATLLPIQSVGVQGDRRSYSFVVALSTDQKKTPWKALFFLSKVIPRLLQNVNRVVYAFGTAVRHPVLDITPTFLTSNVIHIAREADYIANKVAEVYNIRKSISQMPVVLLPIHFDRSDGIQKSPSFKWSICLRPVITSDFMTCLPAYPGSHIPEELVLTINCFPLEL